MLRLLLALCAFVACGAFAPTPALQLSKVTASRSDLTMLFAKKAVAKKAVAKKPVKKVVKKAVKKVAAKKPAPKAAPAKKSAPAKKGTYKAAEAGKGGILPWITNAPGTYAQVTKLSAYDFTGDDGDKWIGWGFMPKSVKALYPKGYKGMFNK